MARMGYGFPVTERSRHLQVALISAEPTFRLGFRAMVGPCDDLRLVSDSADARSGFAAIDAEKPDLVVMDLALRGMSGTAATREIKRRAPEARVLLLGGWPCEREVLEGLSAGADGFALKTEPTESILYAIRAVGRGEPYLAPEVRGLTLETARAMQRLSTSARPAPEGAAQTPGVLQVLSAREREVLDLVIKGWRNRDIARELCVSIKTVDTHRTRINRKLRCRSSADLIRFAAENGLLRRPATAAGRESGPTAVLLVEDRTSLQGELLRDLIAQGFSERRVSTLPSALADLYGLAGPSLYVLEGEGDFSAAGDVYRQLSHDPVQAAAVFAFGDADPRAGSSVRALAWLPDAAAGESFLAALQAARARARIAPTEVPTGAPAGATRH
jgi:two-component system, NarL family, response regulator NreC